MLVSFRGYSNKTNKKGARTTEDISPNTIIQYSVPFVHVCISTSRQVLQKANWPTGKWTQSKKRFSGQNCQLSHGRVNPNACRKKEKPAKTTQYATVKLYRKTPVIFIYLIVLRRQHSYRHHFRLFVFLKKKNLSVHVSNECDRDRVIGIVPHAATTKT